MVSDSNAAASTSAAAPAEGGARKRIRKNRSQKRKSRKSNAAAQDDDGSDDDDGSAPTQVPSTSIASAAPPAPVPAIKPAGKPSAPAPKPTPTSALGKVNPHKPSFITRPAAAPGRKFTVSVAIPGSIVLNAQSPELQSRLAAHIARACAIFNVDEIVVFDEGEVRSEAGSDLYQHKHNQQNRGTKRRFPQQEGEGEEAAGPEETGAGEGGKGFDPHTFLARVLQYLETPQYLRKALFPMHRDLRLAGLMPPLDCPHHLRFEDESAYREGVTVDRPHWAQGRGAGNSVYVNIGLRDPIEALLPAGARVETGTRVTVKMPLDRYGQGEIVSPREPVEQLGWYWGYTVRLASSLSTVLTGCPWESYDLVIGTSERGHSLADLALASTSQTPVALPSGETVQPLQQGFEHALIVFGGLSGLEVAVEQDEGIKLDRHTANELFDAWVNVVDGQGSRTIRTEEAIMIALSRVRPLLQEVAAKE